MKAILEIDVPESCSSCIAFDDYGETNPYCLAYQVHINHTSAKVKRAPFCPLKIVPERTETIPSEIRWIDATSYTQRDKERVPREWELEGAPHRIAVHRHLIESDAWFVSCFPLGIDTRRLGKMGADAAQDKALELVMSVINKQITALQDMYMFVRGAKDKPKADNPRGGQE